MKPADLIDKAAHETISTTDRTPAGRTRINTCTILRAYPNGAVEARWETTTYEPTLGCYLTDRRIVSVIRTPDGKALSNITKELPWVMGSPAPEDTDEARAAAHAKATSA